MKGKLVAFTKIWA